MKTELQRITIAEACGWRRISKGISNNVSGKSWGSGIDVNLMGTPPDDKAACEDDEAYKTIPDYLNDLNAMHSAEKTLTDEQYSRFDERLYDLVADTDPMQSTPCEGQGAILMPTRYIRAISATAAQRCEAFLKTIGKWIDLPSAITPRGFDRI